MGRDGTSGLGYYLSVMEPESQAQACKCTSKYTPENTSLHTHTYTRTSACTLAHMHARLLL